MEELILPYLLIFLLSVPPGFAIGSEGEVLVPAKGKAVIYYNEACVDCGGYIDGILLPTLQQFKIKEIIKKDYINQPGNREELFERKKTLGVPLQIQGHITTFVNETIILEGHVPRRIIEELLDLSYKEPDRRLLVLQDEMKNPTQYLLWDFKGAPQTFSIEVPVSTALVHMERPASVSTDRGKILLSAVLATGLLDGVNPCAFAVLLFFIAFLFTLKRRRSNITQTGIIYILGIYLTYFLIGLGLLKAFSLANSPHLMAKIGAFLVILLGAIHIKDYLFPGLPISLRVPKVGEHAIVQWAYRATLPAAFVLGVLVGLCTFPCSGGIYVAMISLLQSQVTYLKGVRYLLLYNLMFVLPLVLILMGASSKVLAGKLLHWEHVWKEKIHLLYGTTMVGVGGLILLWFI